MKTNTVVLAAFTALFLTSLQSHAAIMVDFSGGGGTPLIITLPAIQWTITNAAGFNGHPVFGIGIAVGQSPANSQVGDAFGGNPANWSATGTLTIPAPINGTFLSNNSYSDPLIRGGIVWYALQSNRSATNGNIVTYTGGTFGNDANVAQTFADGLYEVYLVGPANGETVSSAGIATIPEPSISVVALLGLGTMALRRKRA